MHEAQSAARLHAMLHPTKSCLLAPRSFVSRSLGLSWVALVLLALASTGCSDDSTACTSALCQPDGGKLDALRPDGVVADLARADLPTGDLRADLRADVTTQDAALGDSGPYVHEDISVQTLDQWIKASKPLLLIDLREPSELPNTGIIAGTINKPWTSGVLQAEFAQLPKDKPVVLICASGNRSNQAATFLAAKGFMPVYDMLGGMAAWKTAGLPTVTP